MQKKVLLVRITMMIIAVISIYQFSGCSIMGYIVGRGIDKSKAKEAIITGWEVVKVKPGIKVELFLKNGDFLKGTFAGTSGVPLEEYAKNYAEISERRPGGTVLPKLGEEIAITDVSGKKAAYEFSGFDYQYINAKTKNKAKPEWIPLTSVKKIKDSSGNVTEGESLRNLIGQGVIPSLSTHILLEIDTSVTQINPDILEKTTNMTRVPIDSVYQLKMPFKKNAALKGFLIGAAMDIVIIALATNQDSDHSVSSGEPGEVIPTSCPFIYSFDGKRYIRDSEAYGGAILKAAQRTDWDNLDYLKEVQGKYLLKVTNELKETQYINQIKLLVVDHPQGSRVIPSFSGKLHTLSKVQEPIKAEDFYGNNILKFIKAKDDLLWISNPFVKKELERKKDVRDGLFLEFEKTQDVPFVKLVFNLQNTIWGSNMQVQFLKLYGSELKNWYDLMNSSPEDFQKLKRAMLREGMLQVMLWDGKAWQIKDFIWEVGPAIPKDVVVWLDLHNIPDKILKVRLESTAGLWMINSVQADYTEDLPFQVTELSPDEAKDYQGVNLLEPLRGIDEYYYVMSSTRGWAELVFDAPSLKNRCERSFILKSTGYYINDIIAEGEPQKELITRLLNEPGAFGQFNLQILSHYITMALAQPEEDR